MTTKGKTNLVEIFDGRQWDALMVKSLLDNAEIESYLKDEGMGVLAPWNVDAGGAGPVKIFVSDADIDKAREVIDQYEKAEEIKE
jgi:hypothetical protein